LHEHVPSQPLEPQGHTCDLNQRSRLHGFFWCFFVRDTTTTRKQSNKARQSCSYCLYL